MTNCLLLCAKVYIQDTNNTKNNHNKQMLSWKGCKFVVKIKLWASYKVYLPVYNV